MTKHWQRAGLTLDFTFGYHAIRRFVIQTIRYVHLKCNPFISTIWSGDRRIQRFRVRTINDHAVAVAAAVTAADGDAGGDDDADRPDLGLHDSIIFACHVE